MMKPLVTLFLIISVLSLAACEKTPQVDAGNNSKLQRFAFCRSDNENVHIDAVAVIANNCLFVTVPEEANPSRLVPDIRVTDGATVFIDDEPYVKGKAYDFSGDSQMIKIVPNDGSKTNFLKIQVRNGDAEIDNLIYNYLRQYNVPAVSISYAREGKEAYTAAYGYPAMEYSRRCTPETLFRIADVSQSLCAICVLTCKENGLLTLEDKAIGIGGILESQNTSFDKIKVKNLLSHCSGLDDAYINSYNFSVNDFIRAICDGGLQNEILKYDPGEYLYSEYGYCILQRLVEKVSNLSYAHYLRQVMAMAGVRSIQVGNDSEDKYGEKECVYYSHDPDEKDPYSINVSDRGGAIGVIATPQDLTRLLMSIDGGTAVPDILQPETVNEMFSPFPYSTNYPKYGYGWYTQSNGPLKNSYYNYGSMSGSTALCAIFPETGICASFTCNLSLSDKAFRQDTELLFASIAQTIKSKY